MKIQIRVIQDDQTLSFCLQDAYARGEVFIGSRENSYTVLAGLPPNVLGNHWQFGITIVTPERKFLFACETEEDQKDWIAALQTVVDRPMLPQEYAGKLPIVALCLALWPLNWIYLIWHFLDSGGLLQAQTMTVEEPPVQGAGWRQGPESRIWGHTMGAIIKMKRVRTKDLKVSPQPSFPQCACSAAQCHLCHVPDPENESLWGSWMFRLTHLQLEERSVILPWMCRGYVHAWLVCRNQNCAAYISK